MKKKLIELRDFKDKSPNHTFGYMQHKEARDYVNDSCTLAELWCYENDYKVDRPHSYLYRQMYFDLLIISYDSRH